MSLRLSGLRFYKSKLCLRKICPRGTNPGSTALAYSWGHGGKDRMDMVTLVFDRLLPVAVVLCVLCAALSLIILLV